nr:hypothetical protein [Halomonas anticariensis]
MLPWRHDHRHCQKTVCARPYGVKNQLKDLIYNHVNSVFSLIFALSGHRSPTFQTMPEIIHVIDGTTMLNFMGVVKLEPLATTHLLGRDGDWSFPFGYSLAIYNRKLFT